ncbi:serine/threonine-protein kinase [Embleya sp. NPDC005575]|uniref:serine/threonine-protein kinase n=1 Tax=Embleya sp. NPDC005575 TaxID=3156892 RepID=UPI0033B7BD20
MTVLEEPVEVGGYRLLRQLGSGGMGRVYLGRSVRGSFVAVKVIRSELADDAEFRVRFRREVEAGRRVTGPWTAAVLDADPDAARPWLVTRFVAGPSLHEAVRTHGPLSEEAVRALGAGLAAALATVHEAGLVHRDLKPSNVLLTLDGPRLIDFGIARAADATALTTTGVSVGSPAFMSPEQADGREVGPAGDVFSLGSVLVHAATGVGPFGEGNDQAHMYRVIGHEPNLSRVPYSMRLVIEACLQKDPDLRPTPEQIVAALAPEANPRVLFGPGWLPGGVVETMARRAVDLLEIETEPVPADDLAPTRIAGAEPTRVAQAQETRLDPESADAAVARQTGRRRGLWWKYPLVLLLGAGMTAGALYATVGLGKKDKPAAKNLSSTPAQLPVEFAHKWEGLFPMPPDLGVPLKVAVTLSRGQVGDLVGRVTYMNAYGAVMCETPMSLKEYARGRIVLGGGIRPDSSGFCARNDALLSIAADGTLEFASTDTLNRTFATTLRGV